MKTIDQDTKLRAFALFVMAQEKYRECKQFEEQLAKLLGFPDDETYMGCLSDEIYETNGSFDRGLKKEGFSIEAPKKRA